MRLFEWSGVGVGVGFRVGVRVGSVCSVEVIEERSRGIAGVVESDSDMSRHYWESDWICGEQMTSKEWGGLGGIGSIFPED